MIDLSAYSGLTCLMAMVDSMSTEHTLAQVARKMLTEQLKEVCVARQMWYEQKDTCCCGSCQNSLAIKLSMVPIDHALYA